MYERSVESDFPLGGGFIYYWHAHRHALSNDIVYGGLVLIVEETKS